MHEPQPPTTDERGREVHPAFGSIRANRLTVGGGGQGAVLFDSEITHHNVMRITVGHMTRERDLNRDWLFDSGKAVLTVDMTEAQWASFVSSVNTSAVPCTIRGTETDWDVPGIEFESRLALSAEETRGAAQRAFAKVQAAMEAVDALDPKAPAKEKRAAMDTLRAAIRNAPANVQHAATSLTEHTENVVTKARADVEAMVVHKAHQLGLDPAAFGQVQIGAVPTHQTAQIGAPAEEDREGTR